MTLQGFIFPSASSPLREAENSSVRKSLLSRFKSQALTSIHTSHTVSLSRCAQNVLAPLYTMRCRWAYERNTSQYEERSKKWPSIDSPAKTSWKKNHQHRNKSVELIDPEFTFHLFFVIRDIHQMNSSLCLFVLFPSIWNHFCSYLSCMSENVIQVWRSSSIDAHTNCPKLRIKVEYTSTAFVCVRETYSNKILVSIPEIFTGFSPKS